MAVGTAQGVRVYDGLLADIRNRVAGGDLGPTQLLPSENTLARSHNISRWAVREALSVLADEGLVERIPSRGTMVADPRSAERMKISSLAIVVDATVDLGRNGYALEILQHIRANNAKLTQPFNVSYHFHDFTEGDGFLDEVDNDLVVVLPFSGRCQSLLEQRPSGDSPRVICLARELSNDALPQVYVDHKLGTRMAVEYLLGIGHRNILMIAPPSYPGGFSDVRCKVFQELMRQAGLSPLIETTVNHPGYQDVYDALAGHLEARGGPTALFIASGMLAAPAMHALSRMGRDVPDDLSVVTYDDMPDLRSFSPPITAVRQPLQELISVMLHALESCARTGRVARIRSAVRPELVVRASCRAEARTAPTLEISHEVLNSVKQNTASRQLV
jgi:DNA-binding LacI/PurR family transcriptional regulator